MPNSDSSVGSPKPVLEELQARQAGAGELKRCSPAFHMGLLAQWRSDCAAVRRQTDVNAAKHEWDHPEDQKCIHICCDGFGRMGGTHLPAGLFESMVALLIFDTDLLGLKPGVSCGEPRP